MKKKLLVTSLGVFAGLLFFVHLSASRMIWDGFVTKRLEVTVVSARGGHPVLGAMVYHVRDSLLYKEVQDMSPDQQSGYKAVFTENGRSGLTSSNGKTEITCLLSSGGTDTFYHKSGHFVMCGTLVVDINGQTRFAEDLKVPLPHKKWDLDDELPPITLTVTD